MVKRAELPDGRVLEFPDDTPDEVIDRVAGREIRIANLVRERPEEFDPQSEAFQERFGPTSGSFGFLRNIAPGMGKALIDLGLGSTQLLSEGLDVLPGVDLGRQREALAAERTEQRGLDAPLMNSAGGLTGNIAANVGLALTPGGLARGGTGVGANLLRQFSSPTTFGAAVGSGAIQGALQPVGEDESRAFNVGAGAGFGAVGQAITRPFSSQLSAGQRRALQALDDANVPTDVAERTGSGAAKRLAALLDDSFVTGGQREAFKDRQLRAFTRAILRTIGEDADEATETVMLSAKNRIGSVFDDFADNVPTRANTQFYDDMARIYDDAQQSLTGTEFRLFERNFTNILGSVDDGVINGSRFTRHLRQLGNLSRRADVGEHARAMEHALLDALENSHSAQSRQAIQAARAQWRNLRTIQGAIEKGEDRLISPLRLSNALSNKRNQGLSVFGQGSAITQELAQLARAGRTILGEFANSGTPLRQQIPTGVALGGLGAAGGLPAIAAGAIGARGVTGAIQNQGLIGRLLAGGTPEAVSAPITQALIRQGILSQEQFFE
jgi:hypothetical protein